MTKFKLTLLTTAYMLMLFFTVSCEKDDETDAPVVVTDNRIFIVNEGPFQNGSGSLSVFYRNNEELYNNVFESVNGFAPGNLVQSVSVHEDKVYIVVNNAGKIEVAGINDLVSTGSIEGINNPRYFLGIDMGKAYVSSWDNKVYVLDLTTNTVVSEIPTATGPEKMMKVGDEVWVLNQGGFSYDSTITIINSLNDAVLENVVVGHKPSGIVTDRDGMVWVMCSGNGWNGFPGSDDTEGKLVCLDPDDHSIVKTLVFPATDMHPEKLAIDHSGDVMFYNYPGGLLSQDVGEATLQMDTVYTSTTMFYALGYDPVSKYVFVSDPLDYTQRGKVYRIDPTSGELRGAFEAGVIPGEFYFN